MTDSQTFTGAVPKEELEQRQMAATERAYRYELERNELANNLSEANFTGETTLINTIYGTYRVKVVGRD